MGSCNFEIMFTLHHVSHFMCHMSCVMCHMSCVMCHMLHVMCHMSCVTCHISCHVMSCVTVSDFSKHRPSGPMLSISRNVRLSVRLSVHVFVCSLLRYRLTVFLPPLPEVKCQIFLEIRNTWGKVMERSGLTLEHFCLEVV